MANKKKRKYEHAVILGSRGGKARRKALTPEQRSEMARHAAMARWFKVKKVTGTRAK